MAANHSVWDLELDYLSVESLLLIYADFRVKQTRDGQGREVTKIFSLAEAFNVILSKLDGVDWEKRRRYELVYARLYDFEQFMLARGVDVTLLGRDTPPRPEKHTALMTDQEALDALTMQCVGHNIGLMHRLTGQRSFASLLEQARGETNWRRLRAYLGVFESYSLYLHIPQKVQTLAFLYELLMHREGDIRRQAAALLGEIIAGFHAGYAKERPADSRPFQYITRCPECGTPLVKYEGESKHYCPNQSHCRPQILGRIIHFIRRKAMDIEGLGEETVELLFENGLLHDIADLYDLRAEQLACLPRLGEKSAENIIRSIRGSVEVPFQRVLFALGIRFVGETTAKYLAAHFRTLDAVMHATREELIEADEVGGKIADAIIDYFADAENLRIIERLRKAGLQTEAAHKALESESLAGKNFVITGRFSGHSRDELKELIEAHGGKNLAAVSANVDFLVAGEKIGPAKLQKATKLGVRLISEEELLAMIASGGTLPVTENASDGNTSAAPPSAQETTDKTDGGNTEQGSLF